MFQRKLGIRHLTKAVIILLLACGLVIATCPKAISQEKERTEIIEMAKKEGEVVLYTGVSVRDIQEITPMFEKKYPFVKTKVFRLGSASLFARAQAEYKTGRYLADIFNPSLWAIQQFFEAGMLGTYRSPEREAVPEFAKDKEGYWTCDYINVATIAYNTRLVPSDRAPKTYQDLLDPWWKGKIGLDDTGYRWYTCMLRILGEDNGRIFMKKLAQQNIGIRRGQNLLSQLLAAGEFAAIINAHNNDIEVLKGSGASVDWIAPIDQPTITTPHVITIAKNPPHPNAAKLYIDFILSKEGQQIFSKLTNVPARADVLPTPPRLIQGPDAKKLNFLPIDLELANKATLLQKEFRELFIPHKGK